MSTTFKLLIASLVFLCILKRGLAQCTLSDVTVTQTEAGAHVQGKPEYQVVVANNCICGQENLLLNCKGFQSVEQIDPNLFKSVGNDLCSVNNETPVFQGSDVKFKYAWDAQFDLSPASSVLICS